MKIVSIILKMADVSNVIGTAVEVIILKSCLDKMRLKKIELGRDRLHRLAPQAARRSVTPP